MENFGGKVAEGADWRATTAGGLHLLDTGALAGEILADLFQVLPRIRRTQSMGLVQALKHVSCEKNPANMCSGGLQSFNAL